MPLWGCRFPWLGLQEGAARCAVSAPGHSRLSAVRRFLCVCVAVLSFLRESEEVGLSGGVEMARPGWASTVCGLGSLGAARWLWQVTFALAPLAGVL